MIKGIIFDCFGVLTSDGWLPFKEKYFKNSPDKYDEATRLNALANGSKIAFTDFLSQVADLAGVSSEQLNTEMHKSVANTPIFSLINNLKQDYKIGFLSNVSGDWLPELFTKDQLASFDAMTLSSKIGFVKPDPMSYKAAAQDIGLAPSECLFIDDQPSFIDGARQVGMQAIHFQTQEQLEHDLEEMLATDSNK
jgi:FMN phosphatase YigB (HAD superfamily)